MSPTTSFGLTRARRLVGLLALLLAAAYGIDAWQTLSEHGADLVVSDVEMPHMNGFLLTEAIRGSKRFHDLPVILVTAMENETDKARGLAAGGAIECRRGGRRFWVRSCRCGAAFCAAFHYRGPVHVGCRGG